MQKALFLKIKTIAIQILALVGAFKIAAIALPHLLSNGSPTSRSGELLTKEVASPSGRHKAIVFTNADGGAISPYCYQRISIALATVKISDVELLPKHEVYSGPCDSFANHEASPKLQWTTDSSLRIEFPINSTATSPSAVSLKKSDASNTIAVSFYAHE